MKKIVQRDEPVLRNTATPVPLAEILSPKIQKIISEMKESLASQDDGVAIAAPQIGYPLRIFVVSKKVAHIMKKSPTKDYTTGEDVVYINPIISKLSKDKQLMEEGCLSVRYLYGKVRRSKKATIEAYNEHGKKFTAGASGILAQIFQHETDHLNGILFIDKAKQIEEILPEHMSHHHDHTH
ncbi:MAG: peptide deformylase [Patescibacteria group bacterium]|jgi:peptide deformylase|nr:peptide deformylase [Patescibacteria group bacterium]